MEKIEKSWNVGEDRSGTIANMKDFALLFGGPLKQMACAAPCVAAAASRIGPGPGSPSCMKLISWNLLATPYNRRNGQRESETEWPARTQQQIAHVAAADADVIGLQEFWTHDERHVKMWKSFAAESGYTMHVVSRTNGKSDGCALLVRLPTSDVEFTAYHFDDWGSRILQVAELSLAGEHLTLMNTHLTFPHDNPHDLPMRRQQARKISELTRLRNGPLCVFGDLNGNLCALADPLRPHSILRLTRQSSIRRCLVVSCCDREDPAVSVLTSFGGLRAPPIPLHMDGTGPECDWASHVAHTGSLMACDLVLTRGACRIAEWKLAGTKDELVSGELPSDHRAVHATLLLGQAASDTLAAQDRDDVDEAEQLVAMH